MNSFFEFFPIIFGAVFLMFLAVFVLIFVTVLRRWHGNNKSPVLTVDASVVTKRTRISGTNRGSQLNGHTHFSNTTYYYVTFEVESGDRMELAVSGEDYGMLAEGDRGRLTFQGTRYLGFERIK